MRGGHRAGQSPGPGEGSSATSTPDKDRPEGSSLTRRRFGTVLGEVDKTSEEHEQDPAIVDVVSDEDEVDGLPGGQPEHDADGARKRKRQVAKEQEWQRELLARDKCNDPYIFAQQFVYGRDDTLAQLCHQGGLEAAGADSNVQQEIQARWAAYGFWKGGHELAEGKGKHVYGKNVVSEAASLAVSKMGVMHDQLPQNVAQSQWPQCIISAMVNNDMFGKSREVCANTPAMHPRTCVCCACSEA
jgi:hypothetical protein